MTPQKKGRGPLRVDYVPIGKVKPSKNNTRTHSPAQIDAIRKSIEAVGWTKPIIVDDKFEILAGHGAYMAAQQAGMTEIPIIQRSGLTSAMRRAYRIADNKIAEQSEWDTSILAAEFAELQRMGFDMALTGFDTAEIDEILFVKPAAVIHEDEVPEVRAEVVSQIGDLWILGKHHLCCGDSTDTNAVAKCLNGLTADLLLSDPPYGIGYEYETHNDSDNGVNAQLVWDAFALGPDAKVWTPGLNNLARDISRFGKARVIVWFKKFAAAGNGLGGASTWEPILSVGRTPARKLNNDVLEIMTDRESVDGVSLRKLHSCPKPVALYKALIEGLTKSSSSVYDPFIGSGTTLIAAEQTGRRCYAMEVTPAYVDVAVRRWQIMTGKQATHASEKKTFEAIAKARGKG